MRRGDICGVVLMGGLSQRMGRDKSMIDFDNEKLYVRAARTLSGLVSDVYLSVNEIQATANNYEWLVITDKWAGEGPLSGVISAFDALQKPLLILACDMPSVEAEDMKCLLDMYMSSQKTTMFFNNISGRPEPLASVWSTEDLAGLKDYFHAGGRSFKGYLAQNPCNFMTHQDIMIFRNLNSPDDLDRV
jgi:molybdopterin-guanine dinucleotide biosynthesis protein A